VGFIVFKCLIIMELTVIEALNPILYLYICYSNQPFLFLYSSYPLIDSILFTVVTCIKSALIFIEYSNMGKVHGSLARAGKVKGQTPKVDKQEDKKKMPRGRAKKRMQYNRRYVNVVTGMGGKKVGPNSNADKM